MRGRVLLALGLVASAACTEDTDDLGPGAGLDAGWPPDTTVLLPDAGPPADAGSAPDAAPDAGTPDLGVPDAAPEDAGAPDATSLEVTYLKAATPGLVHRFGDAVHVSRDDSALLVGSPKYEEPLLDRYDLSDRTWTPERTELRARGMASDWGPLALDATDDVTRVLFGHGDAIHLTRATPDEHGYALVLDRDAGGYAATGLAADVPVPLSSYGYAVAMSGDGQLAAVGVPRFLPDLERFTAGPGVVLLFRRRPAGWTQVARLVAPEDPALMRFGGALSMSADGRTLAVGAPGPIVNLGTLGAVVVYDLSATSPMMQAILTSPAGTTDGFGAAVDLSRDGSVLVVGVPNDHGDATGVGAPAGGFGALESGGAMIFRRVATPEIWSPEVYLKPSNTHEDAAFGSSVTISADGARVAVGAPFDAAAGAGVDGAQAPPPLGQRSPSGAVFLYARDANGWRQTAFLKPDAPDRNDCFGAAVAFGRRVLAVGMPEDDSAAAGPNGDPTDDSRSGSGAVYVYRVP